MSLDTDVDLEAFISGKDDLSGADIRVSRLLNHPPSCIVNLYGSWNACIEGTSNEGEDG